ncbi:hypothetical protein FOPG_17037 [Fusarium oxysporum f. sp. conglutinans race 2 54008]|uniref:Uncharacterized protein n=1 Tax=Fusarium oxysporum f. sp. conglutinans race 2 54008 TaxID=1089457 RepID=X0H494_FUSOX|nr:hypothetical protein FOPG_17037 [Fusarium oxysporum f. sp. conglutinans race 2 54008]
MSSNWEMAGSAKRRAILGAIPEEWRLREPLPPAGEYPDITGTFLHRYLTDAEIAITENPSRRPCRCYDDRQIERRGGCESV